MNVCDTCEIAYISKERKYINDCPLCYANNEIRELKEEIKTLKMDIENLEDALDKT